VIGISNDSLATLQRFQEKIGTGQQFVSDPQKEITKAYGAELRVLALSLAKRMTFVISKDGKIVHKVYDWNPLTNVSSVYSWLKDHPQV